MGDHGGLDRAVTSQRFLRIVAALVPAPRRSRWLEEWSSELWYYRRRLERGESRFAAEMALWARMLGAVPHALWVLGEEWMIGSVHRDLGLAVRTLAKRPGYVLAAVGTLAMGIAASTMLFSIVNAVMFRPLPYPDARELVRVFETHLAQGIRRGSVTGATFYDWKASNRVFEDLAAYQSGWKYIVDAGDGATLVPGARVFPNMFALLGSNAALGRTFFPQENHPDDQQSAVISHALWQSLFGGTPDVVGRSILLEGAPRTIVGVMPPGFAFPDDDVGIWIPYNLGEAGRANRRSHLLRVVARLRSGVDVPQAERELGTIMQDLVSQFPQEMEGAGVSIVSWHESLVGDVRGTLLLLFGGVTTLLAVACLNVAGLGVARSRRREREMAVRIALGAGSLRISRLLLTESVVIAAAAGVIGGLIAVWGTPVLLAYAPIDLPRVAEVTADTRVLAFTVLVSAGAALVSGIFPALRLSSSRIGDALRRGSRGATSGDRWYLDGLVTAEIALSVALLAGAGLLTRSYANLTAVDPGFSGDRVITISILPTAVAYPDVTAQTALFDRVLERVQALPGVTSAGLVTELPFTVPASTWSFLPEGSTPQFDQIGVHWNPASTGYFQTMGIPLRRGRLFDDRDRIGDGRVVVIDESTARRFLGDRDPLGVRIRMAPEGELYTIIGVVGAVRQESLREDVQLTMYTPHWDTEPWRRDKTLAVKTDLSLAGFAAAVSAEVKAVDPGLALDRVGPLVDIVSDSLDGERFRLYLMLTFAILALALTVVGLYGTLAYVVSGRRRELAIRSALGARPSSLAAMVFRRSTTLALMGGAAGVLLAIAASPLVRALLFGVAPVDPITLAAVVAVLGLAAVAGTTLPALRVVRLNAATVLSEE